MAIKGRVIGICISDTKGIAKTAIDKVRIIKEFGLEGDAHGGSGHRQVSVLSDEIVDALCDPDVDSSPGAFGENIRTTGIDLEGIPIGTELMIGDVRFEVTQIGKKSPDGTVLYDPLGMRIGPTKVVFCSVSKGGTIQTGDLIETA